MIDNKTVIEVITDYIFSKMVEYCEEGRGGFNVSIEYYPLFILKSEIYNDLIKFMGLEEVNHYEVDMRIVKERIHYLADNMYNNINVSFIDGSLQITVYEKELKKRR